MLEREDKTKIKCKRYQKVALCPFCGDFMTPFQDFRGYGNSFDWYNCDCCELNNWEGIMPKPDWDFCMFICEKRNCNPKDAYGRKDKTNK